jgi:hypothetical protein
MLFACWIAKATDIHSEYVILIAFPQQQWLSERALIFTLMRTVSVLFSGLWGMYKTAEL